MSEVRVKVVAENQTKTGFQAALNDAKAFGREATKAATPGGAGGGEGAASRSGKVSGALRGLANDLANATSPGQLLESILNRVSSAMGGLVAATAGFAIGTVIRRTLEDAAAGLNSLIDQSESLQQKFGNLLAPTTTFSQLASAVQTAAAEIEALKKANEELQSGFGFQLADYLSTYDLSTTANRVAEGGEQEAKATGTVAILAMMAQENKLAKARTDEERALIGLQAQRGQFRAQAVRAFGPQAGEASDRLFAAQDRTTVAERVEKAKAAFRAESKKTKQAGMSTQEKLDEEKITQEKLAGEAVGASSGARSFAEIEARVLEINTKIEQSKQRQIALENELAKAAEVEAKKKRTTLKSAQEQAAANEKATRTPQEQMDFEMQGLADLEGFSGPGVELEKQQAISRIMALQGQMGKEGALTGTSGASGLQRIGFASSESFDARRREDPNKETKRAADAAKSILEIIKKGGPINLQATS